MLNLRIHLLLTTANKLIAELLSGKDTEGAIIRMNAFLNEQAQLLKSKSRIKTVVLNKGLLNTVNLFQLELLSLVKICAQTDLPYPTHDAHTKTSNTLTDAEFIKTLKSSTNKTEMLTAFLALKEFPALLSGPSLFFELIAENRLEACAFALSVACPATQSSYIGDVLYTQTALHVAAEHSTPILLMLLDLNLKNTNLLIKPLFQLHDKNALGETVFHVIAAKSSPIAGELHVLMQADTHAKQYQSSSVSPLNIRDKQRCTPLLTALKTAAKIAESKPFSSENALALLDYDQDVNAENKQRETPLFLACKLGSVELIYALIMRGARLTSDDPLSPNPLGEIMGWNHSIYLETAIDALIEANEKRPTKRDLKDIVFDGKNLLHLAVKKGCVASVQKLLIADPLLAQQTDHQGQTASELARKSGQRDLKALLPDAAPPARCSIQ